MHKIDEKHIVVGRTVFRIVRSRTGRTCSVCGCYACRSQGRLYSATCYKLIGNDCYLKYESGATGKDKE